MTTETKTGGDWDLRTVDWETKLIGPITGQIIDADKRVRKKFKNGFPNWDMYRSAYAGDTLLRRRLQDWCIAFSIAHCYSGGMRKPEEVVGFVVGKDVFYCLMTTHWMAPSDETAEALEISPNTYRKVRDAVFARLMFSLRNYWDELNIAIREVAQDEKRQDMPTPASVYTLIDPALGVSRSGNYIRANKYSE